jgi:hypothetical protein
VQFDKKIGIRRSHECSLRGPFRLAGSAGAVLRFGQLGSEPDALRGARGRAVAGLLEEVDRVARCLGDQCGCGVREPVKKHPVEWCGVG